jgi:hypothetical protein
LDEIQEYRQVMAIADSKINEYEALHARMLQPSAVPHVAQAWNLSEPARAVQQTDTYVLQSSPEKAVNGKAADSAGALPDDGDEVDEYDDMLQVDIRIAINRADCVLIVFSSVCQQRRHA